MGVKEMPFQSCSAIYMDSSRRDDFQSHNGYDQRKDKEKSPETYRLFKENDTDYNRTDRAYTRPDGISRSDRQGFQYLRHDVQAKRDGACRAYAP